LIPVEELLMQIIPYKDHFEDIVHFATRLNSNGLNHIGFFGDGEVDVRLSLAECIIPPADGFLLAYDEGKLVGLFGVDADSEIDRAWLFGPLVEYSDWHSVADELYERILKLIPENIHEYELFCDIQNVHMKEFAAQHGYHLHAENTIMTLTQNAYIPSAKGRTQIIHYQEEFFEQLDKLHKTLFPNAYFTARQMVERLNEKQRFFFAIDDNRLLGYNFCKVEAESGYVDFIGTDSFARGRGVGTDLLTSGIDWMFANPSTKKINLTVNSDNIAARNLYEKFGFVIERMMRSYRKQIN
jgi:RimJ/RimL family protein N-acetyltransferase